MTTTRQAPEGDEQGLGGPPRSVLPATAADRLIRARNAGAGIGWREVLPADVDAAYAVQDATVARLGSVRAWKVGAKGRQITPICAPLPAPDLLTLQATLQFDGRTVAETCGGNPAQDVWRLLGWLIGHCAERGAPLREGQFVTTGSCTGMLFAPQGTLVQARLTGFGGVVLRF